MKKLVGLMLAVMMALTVMLPLTALAEWCIPSFRNISSRASCWVRLRADMILLGML